MPTNKGYIFEAEVARGLKQAGLYFFKIPDTKMVGMVNAYLRKMGLHPIIFPKIPADYLIHSPMGQTIYLECKATDAKTFPFVRIKPHQLQAGLELSGLHDNINYWFLIEMKYHKRCFLIHPVTIYRMMQNGWASANIMDFEYYGLEVPRLTAKHHPTKEGAFIQLDALLL